MFVVSVLYPATAGARFDFEYYVDSHLKLVRERWQDLGLQSMTALRGIGTPDGGDAPYVMMVNLMWESKRQFGAAAKAHGAEIFGDVANFTAIAPAIQFSETVA